VIPVLIESGPKRSFKKEKEEKEEVIPVRSESGRDTSSKK
jgi:hypothetical protein